MLTMPASSQVRWAAALGGLAAWAIAVPWLGQAVGIEFYVATRLEIADHVVPGVVLLAGAVVLAARGGPAGDTVSLGAGAVTFLAGLWITATHVPLIFDALEGAVTWGAALLHFSPGPPLLILGLWILWRSELFGGARGVQREK